MIIPLGYPFLASVPDLLLWLPYLLTGAQPSSSVTLLFSGGGFTDVSVTPLSTSLRARLPHRPERAGGDGAKGRGPQGWVPAGASAHDWAHSPRAPSPFYRRRHHDRRPNARRASRHRRCPHAPPVHSSPRPRSSPRTPEASVGPGPPGLPRVSARLEDGHRRRGGSVFEAPTHHSSLTTEASCSTTTKGGTRPAPRLQPCPSHVADGGRKVTDVGSTGLRGTSFTRKRRTSVTRREESEDRRITRDHNWREDVNGLRRASSLLSKAGQEGVALRYCSRKRLREWASRDPDPLVSSEST